MSKAACQQCNKQYKIRNETKKYTCTVCGGTVVAIKTWRSSGFSDRPGFDLEGITCPECQRFNPSLEARFCMECEAPLHRTDTLRDSARKKTKSELADDKAAAMELRKIMTFVTAIRSFYYAGAIIFLAPFLAILILALKTGRPAFFKSLYSIPYILLFLATCLTLWGARKIITHPLLCSVVVAVLVTILTLPLFLGVLGSELTAVMNYSPLSLILKIFLLFMAFVVISVWWAVSAASNVKALAALYPNIQITRSLSTREGKLVWTKWKGPPGKARKRFKARSRVGRNQVLVWCGIAACIAILLFIILNMMEPPSLDSRAEDFLQTWNGTMSVEESIPKMAAFFQAESWERIRRQLEIKFKKYDWEQSHPRLSEPKIETIGQGGARVAYPMFLAIDEVVFETYWKKDPNGNWYLKRLAFPDGLVRSQ